MQRRHVPLLLLILSCVISIPSPIRATTYSIPVNGRFVTSRITLKIPSTPKWAHDVVLNASLAWNNGQLWFQHTYFPDGNVYTFVESNLANVTVNFEIPSACGGLAVGWTDYTYAPSSTTILSARTYLDPTVFNAAQENNDTAKQYAFRLALHELGRVLGLGNLIDGNDIMDPLATPTRATQPPMISTLDLYAVHVLASEVTLTSLVIVLNTDQYQLMNAWTLLTNANGFVLSLDSPVKDAAHIYNHRELATVNKTSRFAHQQGSVDQLRQYSILAGYLTPLMLLACACSVFGTRYRSKRSMGIMGVNYRSRSSRPRVPSNSHIHEFSLRVDMPESSVA
ncbi:MAG: hypothetical protein ABSA92_07720 [Candidatus Bathyarchaeia archaeon]